MMKNINEVFNQLTGTFKTNSSGWNITWQPADNAIAGLFANELQQTLTFTQLPGVTRNTGIDLEGGFLRNVRYSQSITDKRGDVIHDEHGYISLDVTENGIAPNAKYGYIARSGTIPRKLAFLTTGILHQKGIAGSENIYSGMPAIADQQRSKPRSDQEAMQIGEQYDANRNAILEAGGPDIDNPLPWLDDFDEEPEMWNFCFRDTDPKNSGTISGLGQVMSHPVGVGTLLSDFWFTGDELRFAQVEDNRFWRYSFPHVAVDKLSR